jgi:hypothetical protein
MNPIDAAFPTESATPDDDVFSFSGSGTSSIVQSVANRARAFFRDSILGTFFYSISQILLFPGLRHLSYVAYQPQTAT